MPRTLQVVIPRRPKAAKSEAKTEMTETCRKRWSLLYFLAIIYKISLVNTKKTFCKKKTLRNPQTHTCTDTLSGTTAARFCSGRHPHTAAGVCAAYLNPPRWLDATGTAYTTTDRLTAYMQR